jgi:hypothetical protein
MTRASEPPMKQRRSAGVLHKFDFIRFLDSGKWRLLLRRVPLLSGIRRY